MEPHIIITNKLCTCNDFSLLNRYEKSYIRKLRQQLYKLGSISLTKLKLFSCLHLRIIQTSHICGIKPRNDIINDIYVHDVT